MAPKAFRVDDNGVVDGSGGRANKKISNSFKNLTDIPNIRATKKSTFLTSNAKKIFNHLWLAFIKVLILQHFDLESYI